MDYHYWVVQVIIVIKRNLLRLLNFDFFKLFLFILNSCLECEKCEKPGHICDVDTGRCVCPQLTEGLDCSQCTINAFGWEANKGCQVSCG